MLLTGLLALVFLASPPVLAVDVGGDDERDVYVGAGGLILPSSVGADTRTSVARCAGCRWRMTEVCADSCTGVVRGCPQGRQLLRTLISRDGGASWEEIGLVCIAEAPITVGEAGASVRSAFIEGLPPLRPAAQPPAGVLPRLPLILSSGQPAAIPPFAHELAGLPVVLSARPSWNWDCGDGRRFSTGLPGSRYPDARVSCTFARPGLWRVTVRTTWTAEFTVDGMGPFPVEGEIGQLAALEVPVGQARAVLIPAR